MSSNHDAHICFPCSLSICTRFWPCHRPHVAVRRAPVRRPRFSPPVLLQGVPWPWARCCRLSLQQRCLLHPCRWPAKRHCVVMLRSVAWLEVEERLDLIAWEIKDLGGYP
uniref:Uncharacterized protein n=1 Tax=Setaria viridis TaxID=4556 RepID=A0A4U6V0B1_SETVI|nr:hypothetical protein SEVIR_4G163200v2 [Setaria viridis]